MRTAILMFGALMLGGCSVGMAARTGGVKTEEVTQCETRQCFLTQDTIEILETASNEDGGISETYRFQLKRGSAGRAAMHGLLDVATLGVWEVAGTPIEASKEKKYIVITAIYAPDGRLKSKVIGNPVLIPESDDTKAADLPQGTPVTANGKIVGVLTKEGDFIPLSKNGKDETDGKALDALNEVES